MLKYQTHSLTINREEPVPSEQKTDKGKLISPTSPTFPLFVIDELEVWFHSDTQLKSLFCFALNHGL